MPRRTHGPGLREAAAAPAGPREGPCNEKPPVKGGFLMFTAISGLTPAEP